MNACRPLALARIRSARRYPGEQCLPFRMAAVAQIFSETVFKISSQ